VRLRLQRQRRRLLGQFELDPERQVFDSPWRGDARHPLVGLRRESLAGDPRRDGCADFTHYRGNPRVLSWEVFNEPDFDVWNGKVSQSSMASTVTAVAASVHANSTAYVTVGMGFADGLPMVVGTGLDYYQAHWYDYMSGGTYCMRCNNYAFYQAKFGLDQPLVVGEFYAGSNVDSYQRYQDFYNKGYAGAWGWSLSPEKTSDHMAIDYAAARKFANRHSDLGPRLR
jgi:hypothetical protein